MDPLLQEEKQVADRRKLEGLFVVLGSKRMSSRDGLGAGVAVAVEVEARQDGM